MHETLNQAGFWVSLVLLGLWLLGTGMGWNAYSPVPGGDAAGNGMARGFHGLFLIASNIAAFVCAGCFALALAFPTGVVHLLVRVLGWVLLPPVLVLFVGLLRR